MRHFLSFLAIIGTLALALFALLDRQGSTPRRYVVNRSFEVEE